MFTAVSSGILRTPASELAAPLTECSRTRQGNPRNPIWIRDEEEDEDDAFEGNEEYDAEDAVEVEWAEYGAPIRPCCSICGNGV